MHEEIVPETIVIYPDDKYPSDEEMRDFFIWEVLTRLASEIEELARQAHLNNQEIKKARSDYIFAGVKDVAEVLTGMVAQGVAAKFATLPPELLWQGIAPNSVPFRIMRRAHHHKTAPPWDVEVLHQMEGGEQWLPLDIDAPDDARMAARLVLWAITSPDEYPDEDDEDKDDWDNRNEGEDGDSDDLDEGQNESNPIALDERRDGFGYDDY